MTAPISNGPTTTRLHHYAGHYFHLCNVIENAGLKHLCYIHEFTFEVHNIACGFCLCTNDKSEARSTHNTLLLHRIESG